MMGVVGLPFPYPDLQVDHMNLLKQFEHLDPQNQHTFEARDLELLIQTVGEGEGEPAEMLSRRGRGTRSCLLVEGSGAGLG